MTTVPTPEDDPVPETTEPTLSVQLKMLDPEIEVRQIPMGIPLPPPADDVAGLEVRRRIGVGAEVPLIGSIRMERICRSIKLKVYTTTSTPRV